MDPVVAAALIGLLGTLALGALGLVQAHSNGRAMRTNNGKRPGEYIELTAASINDLREDLAQHTRQDEANFQALRAQLAAEGIATRQNTRDRAAEIQEGRIDT